MQLSLHSTAQAQLHFVSLVLVASDGTASTPIKSATQPSEVPPATLPCGWGQAHVVIHNFRQNPCQTATLAKDGWIVDYPAGMDLGLASHMRDADLVIVPSHASTFDVEGISQTLKFVQANAGPKTKICFFGTALSNEQSADFLRDGVAKYGFPLIGYFKHRVVYERSRLSGKPASALNKAAKVEVQAAVKAIYEYLGEVA